MGRKVVAAAVHAAPVFMNKTATLNKTIDIINKAGSESIKLLVFPETFVPGYPVSSPPLSLHTAELGLTVLVLHRMLPADQASWCASRICPTKRHSELGGSARCASCLR